MKKIAVIAGILCMTGVNISYACTTFFLKKNNEMVFGRNYDWVTGTGVVNTNLRGLVKSSLRVEKGNTITWTSLYGSITFNQYGKEFPNGGMNEKGLVIELMWLSNSQFPTPDKRPALTVLQWIQYQLDNCASIKDVIATDKKIRIANTGTPQHYLIADSKGAVATIEFLDGKMVVHAGKNLPYPVLANDTYASSLQAMNLISTAKNTTANSNSSDDRFIKACTMVQNYQNTNINKPLVDYSFDILNKVSQGSFTKWSIVYDITHKKIFFKTAEHQQVKFIELNGFDFSCNSNPKALNMNEDFSGDANKHFIAFDHNINRRMLKDAFIESKDEISINDDLQNAAADIAKKVKCKN